MVGSEDGNGEATSAEQTTVEQTSGVQATAERPAADKAGAEKPAPEQHGTVKHAAEAVRARRKLPLIWLIAAAILLTVVTGMAATAYLPHVTATAPIVAPAFAPSPASPTAASEPTPALSPSPALSPDPTARPDPRPAPYTAAEIRILIERGDMLIGRGDLANTRLFYQRAVDAGDAQAAIYLGATYDPSFLSRARLGKAVRGNLDRAAYWYRRARELGSSEAVALLKTIRNSGSPR